MGNGTLLTRVEAADARFGAKGAVGIGFPGIINRLDGSIVAANLPAIHGRHLGADLAELLGRPVRVDNDGLVDQYYIEEHHEALVSHEDFDFVQELISHSLLNAKRSTFSDEEKELLKECEERRKLHERSDKNTGQKSGEAEA